MNILVWCVSGRSFLRQTIQHDKYESRGAFPQDQRGGDAGIYAGFCEAGGELRRKGNPRYEKEDIAAAFEEAKKNTKTPTLIEFIIDPEEMVYPMIRPGGTLEDMIMDC